MENRNKLIEIKNNWQEAKETLTNPTLTFPDEDIEWLIQQAEKVEQLQKTLESLKNLALNTFNARLKEVLRSD